MRKSLWTTMRSLVILMLLLLVTGCVFADTVTIGGNDRANIFPFISSGYVGEYQQVYSAADFSGPVYINSITFFAAEGFSASITGTYTIDFSTTTAAVNGLSTTYANNIGGDNATFFNGSVTNVLSFAGTPFYYDPGNGNLLMDVVVVATNSGSGALAAGDVADTSRVFNSGGNGAPTADAGGLFTQFDVSVRSVPEPSSLILLGSGLAGISGAIRRKLKR